MWKLKKKIIWKEFSLINHLNFFNFQFSLSYLLSHYFHLSLVRNVIFSQTNFRLGLVNFDANKNKILQDEAQKHMRYLTINFNLYSIRYNKAKWNERKESWKENSIFMDLWRVLKAM